MPGFNPASIGAPSPVGRGGGSGGSLVGGILFSDAPPFPAGKHTLCNNQLADVDLATWPYAPAGVPPAGFSNRSAALGSVNDGNALPPVYLPSAGLFVWGTFANGPLWTSPNGFTWTSITNPAGGSIRGLQVCFGRLFLFSDGGLWWTTDAVNWTKVSGVPGGYYMQSSPGCLYFCGTRSNTDYFTLDGVNFFPVTTSLAVSGYQTIYCFYIPKQNRFIINRNNVGNGAYETHYLDKLTSGAVATSTPNVSNTGVTRSEFFAGKFLLWSGGNTFQITPDWQTFATPIFNGAVSPIGSMFIAGSQVYIVGNSGAVHMSYDGVTYNNMGGDQTLSTSFTTVGGAYGNGVLINMKTNGSGGYAPLILNKGKLPPASALVAPDGRSLDAYMRTAA